MERHNEAVRAAIDLSENWRFHFGDVPASVTDVSYDDSDWQLITVPHTSNRVGSYDVEVPPDTNKEQGIGWYRLQFKMPEHKGAYSHFRFDVTDVLKTGRNVVVVKADNSAAEPGSSTE